MIIKKALKFIKFVLPWIVTLAIFVMLLKKIPGEKVLQILSHVNLKLFLLALIVSAFTHLYVGVERYKQILNLLGCPLSSDKVRTLKLGSLPIKIILPLKSGELIRTMYLKKEYQIPYQKGINSILLGYLFRFLVLVSFFLIGWTLYSDISNISHWWPLLLLILLFLVGYIYIRNNKGKDISLVIFYSVLFEVCLMFNFYIIFRAFDIKVSYAGCLFFIPLTMIAASLPVSIGGFGLREGSILLLFTGFAVSEKLFASGLIISFVNGFFPALIGLYFLQSFVMKLAITSERQRS